MKGWELIVVFGVVIALIVGMLILGPGTYAFGVLYAICVVIGATIFGLIASRTVAEPLARRRNRS